MHDQLTHLKREDRHLWFAFIITSSLAIVSATAGATLLAM